MPDLMLPRALPAQLLPLAIAAALAPLTATAQEASTLDRIEVTGSRIRAADAETRQPILTLTRDDIAKQGFTSVADILQNLSSAGSPAISRADALASGEAVGGYYIDIRNLGAARTLVLLNGRRLGATTSGLQDLGQVPISVIQRIEVLKDGASAIYGSDAIAAVVNVITDSQFDGAEFSARVGQFSQGDGRAQEFSLKIGTQGERSGILLAAEYSKEEPVWAKDRWFSRDGNAGPDYPGSGWSPISKQGAHCDPCSSETVLPKDERWWTLRDGGDPNNPGDYRPFTADDNVNSNEQMMLQTGIERRSLFASAYHDVNDNLRLQGEALYNQRITDQQIAGYPLQYDVPVDSPFNPLGEDTKIRRRLWEVPRTTRSELQTYRLSGGLVGNFELGGRAFDWDVGALVNRNRLTKTGHGDGSRFALDRSLKPECGTAADPNCKPWNPFLPYGVGGPGSLSDPELQKFLFPTFVDTGETTTTTYSANLAGSLFDMPAGEFGFAVGYEHRREQGRFVPDAFSQSGQSTGLESVTTEGAYSLDEVYTELSIPILKDLPFARELTLNAAGRFSKYSNFGNTLNSKFGLTWRPMDELLVRGTIATGFRAPTIADLYGGTASSFESYVDPCGIGATNTVNGNAACTGAGVPLGYEQLGQGGKPCTGYPCQTPDQFFRDSNPDLKPERSTSTTAGVVWSPRWVEGLDVSLDWYKYTIKDQIILDSVDRILRDCYVLGNAARCEGIARGPDGHITNLRYGTTNLGLVQTQGYDLGIRYRLPELAIGQFKVDWQTSYTSQYDEEGSNSKGEKFMDGRVGEPGYFRVRSNIGLDWEKGSWGANYTLRYYSGMRENCVRNRPCTDPDRYANGEPEAIRKVGSNTFHDLQVRWTAPWDATIAVGAKNLFNHQGPIMFSQPGSAFPYYGGFDIGRSIYMKYQQRF
ncbi:TonB-dependent receptor plug domain-containing protein [Stenotrophomonas rhizophila]|uniref:TonB-dependent receptor plug domain-containing protein n=1 Tax=Stenotrophomonas rhizophila TaxID=216778 RepID=UPI001E3482C6|nr:TonB-dependent receptor [Stenotrophomonas rhizophila]MCC7633974.1 TonB-dependent receptor [Stenotrophomonas rhizophila]MCC7663308.1 TonB-dependent receptor [Stenotrophomonas rhizophila]